MGGLYRYNNFNRQQNVEQTAAVSFHYFWELKRPPESTLFPIVREMRAFVDSEGQIYFFTPETSKFFRHFSLFLEFTVSECVNSSRHQVHTRFRFNYCEAGCARK